jgi:beta-ureidopropionase
MVYVVATNAVGPDVGNHYYFDHGMIVHPIAWRLAQERRGEEIVAAKLELDPLRYVTFGSKSEQLLDHLEECNLALNEQIVRVARRRFEPGKRLHQLEPQARGLR